MTRAFFCLGLVTSLIALDGCAQGLAGADGARHPLPYAAGDPQPDRAAAASPHVALDAMDTRVPVPLLPPMALHQKAQMRDHLVAVQEIVAALAADNLEAAATAATRIGFSAEEQQSCEHMGAGASGFTDRALAFHRQADDIVTAARAGNKTESLHALGRTLAMCTSCHATFKQQVVSTGEWSKKTGQDAPMMGGMHHHRR